MPLSIRLVLRLTGRWSRNPGRALITRCRQRHYLLRSNHPLVRFIHRFGCDEWTAPLSTGLSPLCTSEVPDNDIGSLWYSQELSQIP